jgi:site-specific DNA-methyltransferase (adenine-specific)
MIEDLLSGAPWHVEHGDCIEVLKALPDGCIDVCITDPPYSEHVHAGQRRFTLGAQKKGVNRAARVQVKSTPLSFAALDDKTRRAVAKELARLVKRWVLVFSDAEHVHLWREEFTDFGLDHVRVGAWVKPDPGPQMSGDRPAPGFEPIEISHRKGRKRWNGGGHDAVWIHNIVKVKARRLHETQKPLKLMLELVSLFSEPGEFVLDPFCGSGTTGAAALRLGRRFLGVELDDKSHATSVQRLSGEQQGSDIHEYRRGQLSLLGGT